jgi:hypothetical protein
MELDRDFKEFLALLAANKVDYLIVGGYAVAFHGHPRYTGDIDIWVKPSEGNAAKLRKALDSFGFDAEPLTNLDFESETIAFHLGVPPVRIDILNRITGVKFDQCYANKVEIEMEGLRINYISYQDLLTNKKASGRLQDLSDLEKLQ